jgi:hypothetical protein
MQRYVYSPGDWAQGRRSPDNRAGTHAKNVDFPHPASPTRSKETDLLLSGRESASAMLKWLFARFTRNRPGNDQLAPFSRSINEYIAKACLRCECRAVYMINLAFQGTVGVF